MLGERVLRAHFHTPEKIGRCWLVFWAGIPAVVFDRPVSHLVSCYGHFPSQILACYPQYSTPALPLTWRGGVLVLFAQKMARWLCLGGCLVGCLVV